ncbi:shikimate dehydrogenase [Rhodobacterales bacterium LSUCC1028]|uniref:shikimate dehydrogenase n=1 Tax=Roseobacter sp. HKCCA2468 TaxID=3120342 RepID=UPI001D41832E|nr:shikimate dehydrogenase [Rhodobacterales bacterium LSUCC1028]
MTASVPLAAVIGDPIGHSKSPLLHGFWLRAYQISGHYVPLHVTSGDLGQVLAAMQRMGFVGANVTIPHKETVLELADIVTDRARAIGAANTLTFHKDGKIEADNTDGHGFLANIQQNAPAFDAKDGPAVILGAGGAAKAVIYALLEAGAPQVRVLNRNLDRAKNLSARFGDRVSVHEMSDLPNLLGDCNLLVNTTSLGMIGQPPLAVDLSNLPKTAVVNDIVYAPLETDLLKQARAMGAGAVDGLGMLLHQAAPGFAKWFGKEPAVTDELRRAVLAK